MGTPKGKKRKLRQVKNPQVKRLKEDIDNFLGKRTAGVSVESSPGHSRASGLQKSKKKGQKTRKDIRKETRKLKKIRRHAFAQRKEIPTAESLKKEKEEKAKIKNIDQKKKVKREKEKERKVEKKHVQKESHQQEKDVRLKAMEEANMKEDKMIKQLEKQLKMNKRKSKNLPQMFAVEGLDYILDAVDSEKLQAIYDENDDDSLMQPVLDAGSDEDDFSADEEMDSSVDDSADEEEEDAAQIVEVVGDSKSPSSSVKGILKKGTTSTTTEKSVKFGDVPDSSATTENTDKQPRSKEGLLAFLKESIAEVKAERESSKKAKEEGEKSQGVQNTETLDGKSREENEETCSPKPIEASDEGEYLSDEDHSGHHEDFSDDEMEGEEEEDSSENEDEKDGDDDDSGEDEDGDDSGEDEEDDGNEDAGDVDDNYKEDIYGRLRDKDGNVVTKKTVTGAYVPPGKRLEMATTQNEKKRIEIERLKKQLKGFVNRLSESNMQSISSQLEEMFRSRSRAELSESLAAIIMEALIAPTLIPERLIMEQVMLLAILHGNVGSEVGALFLQSIAERFESLFNSDSYGGGKEMDNLLVILAHMYNFKMIHSVLIFDILKKFIESFKERDIELILVLLKSVGFSLRKDDPSSLKDLITEIQAKASSVDTTSFTDQSRVKFMLEVMMAVRNNNMRKIPNYDPSHMEHLRKLLRIYVTGSNYSDLQLRISLEDLLQADSKGRWWLVGSAWSGRAMPGATSSKTSTTVSNNFSDKILELARKQRMNTDVRKNIFCIMMTSEDFVDAFEKLLRLNLKHQQEREIIHVVMDICMQEKEPNPFYAFLTQKFCEFHRRFQMTVQFHIWDLLKVMSEQSTENIHNLAVLVTHLIATKALSLSVFKVVEFSELDKHKLQLLKTVLQSLLMNFQEQTVTGTFSRIAAFPKLAQLREALKVFMRHFLLRKVRGTEEGQELEARIELAVRGLGSAETAMRL